jgi:hypothetical protein
MQTVLSIETDEGVTGHYFGGGSHGDQDGLNVVDQQAIVGRIKNLIVGQDPLDRELIWKWLWVANLPENIASVIDNALWDLAGRAFETPVYKLMGGARDTAKAYASTYPNIGVPRVYAGTRSPAGTRATSPTRSTRTTSGTRRPASPRPDAPRTSRPTSRPSTSCASGRPTRPDVRPVGHVHVARGGDPGRPRARSSTYWYEHPMPEYRVESYALDHEGCRGHASLPSRSWRAASSVGPTGSSVAPAT